MATAPRDSTKPGPVTAVIGDVVASRRFRGRERATLQDTLEQSLSNMNQVYQGAILAEFVLTEGDSFQALLKRAEKIPDIVWDIESLALDAEIRLGVGYGGLETPLRKQAIGMDGPAFHNARDAVRLARKESVLGGVFTGFGQFEDIVLNGLARLLRQHRSRLTEAQKRIADLLRKDPRRTQTSVAKELGITRQAVSDHVKTMGWDVYAAGETAWRATLKRFTDRSGYREDMKG